MAAWARSVNMAPFQRALIPSSLRQRVTIFISLAALVVWYSVQVMKLQVDTDTLMTGFDVNMAFAYAALPLGWGLLIYRVAQRFVRTLRSYSRQGDVPLGGGGFGE